MERHDKNYFHKKINKVLNISDYALVLSDYDLLLEETSKEELKSLGLHFLEIEVTPFSYSGEINAVIIKTDKCLYYLLKYMVIGVLDRINELEKNMTIQLSELFNTRNSLFSEMIYSVLLIIKRRSKISD